MSELSVSECLSTNVYDAVDNTVSTPKKSEIVVYSTDIKPQESVGSKKSTINDSDINAQNQSDNEEIETLLDEAKALLKNKNLSEAQENAIIDKVNKAVKLRIYGINHTPLSNSEMKIYTLVQQKINGKQDEQQYKNMYKTLSKSEKTIYQRVSAFVDNNKGHYISNSMMKYVVKKNCGDFDSGVKETDNLSVELDNIVNAEINTRLNHGGNVLSDKAKASLSSLSNNYNHQDVKYDDPEYLDFIDKLKKEKLSIQLMHTKELLSKNLMIVSY